MVAIGKNANIPHMQCLHVRVGVRCSSRAFKWERAVIVWGQPLEMGTVQFYSFFVFVFASRPARANFIVTGDYYSRAFGSDWILTRDQNLKFHNSLCKILEFQKIQIPCWKVGYRHFPCTPACLYSFLSTMLHFHRVQIIYY